MIYPDARVYEGEWSGDRREGFGSLTYPASVAAGDRGRVSRQYAGVICSLIISFINNFGLLMINFPSIYVSLSI